MAMNSKAFRFISINGKLIENATAATVSVWDTSFHRGDGVFEVMRLLPNGQIRGLDLHLKRLATSANGVKCPLPEASVIQGWLQQAATAAVSSPLNQSQENGAPGCLRLIATKGGSDHNVDPSVIITWAPLPKWPESFSLKPTLAPWHCAGAPGWETPIKWTSYGPNVVSTQKAKDEGFSDALLLSSLRLANSLTPDIKDCHVLDGPNFAVSWIRGSTLYIPNTDELGLLPSITQDLVRTIAQTELGLTVQRGVFALREVLEADEVFVCSTTRGAIPISAIGEHKFTSDNPWTKKLQQSLAKANGMSA